MKKYRFFGLLGNGFDFLKSRPYVSSVLIFSILAAWIIRWDVVQAGPGSMYRVNRWTGTVEFCTQENCRSKTEIETNTGHLAPISDVDMLLQQGEGDSGELVLSKRAKDIIRRSEDIATASVIAAIASALLSMISIALCVIYMRRFNKLDVEKSEP